MSTLTIEKLIPGFVAWTNTDCTEGKGWRVPLAVCETQATAIRLGSKGSVQGSDCEVSKVDLYRINGLWYGPIQLRGTTNEDMREQEKLDNRAKALEKAKAAGLSDDEIKALSL